MEYYNQSLLRQPVRSVTDRLQVSGFPDGNSELHFFLQNWVTLLNYFLAVFVIIHDSITVRFFYLQRADITQLLFLLIGLADIFAAIAMIVLLVSSTLFYNNLIGPLPFQRGIIIHLLLFPAALACSRSLNVIMSLIKTIKIASIARRGTPVQIHNTAVIVLSFFTFLLWLALNTSDVILTWNVVFVHHHTDYLSIEFGLLIMLQYSLFVGLQTSEITTFKIFHELGVKLYQRVYNVFLTIHFILPSIITFVCMLIQACSIKSTLTPTEESNSSEPSASYINTTIFMITALFCFCHTAFLAIIAYSWPSLWCFLEFSLPLINGGLFPLIIILRKQSLRERYRDFFLRVCPTIRSGVGVVARKCGGVVRWVGGIGRRADYKEMSGVEES